MDLKAAADLIIPTLLEGYNGKKVEIAFLDADTVRTSGALATMGKYVVTVTVWFDEVGGLVFVANNSSLYRAPFQTTIPPMFLDEETVLRHAVHAQAVLLGEAERYGY